MANESQSQWAELNRKLPTMTEDELLNAIRLEVTTHCRTSHIKRLHSRYCSLRMKRERDALVAGILVL